MNLDRLTNLAASIVMVALVTVIVSAPRTAEVIRAIASAFAGSLKAAMGQGTYR